MNENRLQTEQTPWLGTGFERLEIGKDVSTRQTQLRLMEKEMVKQTSYRITACTNFENSGTHQAIKESNKRFLTPSNGSDNGGLRLGGILVVCENTERPFLGGDAAPLLINQPYLSIILVVFNGAINHGWNQPNAQRYNSSSCHSLQTYFGL